MINLKNKRGAMALSQIFLLVISIVAIGYALGSEMGEVSATNIPCATACKGFDSFYCNPGAKCAKDGETLRTNTNCAVGTVCCCANIAKKSSTTTSEIKCSEACKAYDISECRDSCRSNEVTMTKTDCSASCCCSAYETDLGGEGVSDKNIPSDNEIKTKTTIMTYEEWKIKNKITTDTESTKTQYEEYKKANEENTTPTPQNEMFSLLNIKKGSTLDLAINAFMWAGIVYLGIKLIGPLLGIEDELVDAAAMAALWGVFAGKLSTSMLTKMGTANAKVWGGVIGAGVGVGLFILMYRKEKQEVITFTCYPWQAATGGANCEKCNKQGVLSCSEYQCRSLGQGCQIVNPGTDEQKCVWVNRNDVKFPTITPWEEALLKDYEYTPDNAISPPDRGVKIELKGSTSGCVKAFTPLSFGVNLDEPAKCKIDGIRKKSFEDMDFFFSQSLSLYNHTYILSLPGSSALKAENISLGTDGEYSLYVRCEDANGNSNTADFVFSFCVEKGPDTTPPLIVTTTPLNGMPIAYNQSSVPVTVYTNEPADCRWSHLDEDYETMEETMSCAHSVLEMNAQQLYRCTTTLTGLKDRQENKFYFRCKDQPTVAEENRNANRESYVYSLIGTQALVIDWVKPENGTVIKDATDFVKVTLEAKTSAGYKEGESTCYYSETGITGSYVAFLNTNSYQHSQDLWLAAGNYEYFIKCIDLGGNADTEVINFEVESDSESPIIVRAYHEETYLKLVTSESASCVYDTKYTDYPCDYPFDKGIPFTAINETDHYTDWDTKTTLYVVCKDKFGNQPLPNACSIIVRPSDFSG